MTPQWQSTAAASETASAFAAGGLAVPRVAVVGCGHWGRNLARNLRGLGALAGVHDRHPSKTRAFAEEFGVPGLALRRILGDETIEAVVVATRAEQHFAVARSALQAGKHVFVEKPLAARLEDATTLCEMAERTGRVLMVGHLLRYHPAFARLEAMVRGGELGRLRYLYSHRLRVGNDRREHDALWSLAPHDVSMILALAGAEPQVRSAAGASYLAHGVPDVATVHLAFAGGERAHVFVSWLNPTKEQRLVVVGTRAMAVFDDDRDWDTKLALHRRPIDWGTGRSHGPVGEGTPVAIAAAEPLAVECRHFLECIATGQRPRTDGAEGLRVLRVLSAADRAMRAGEAAIAAAGPSDGRPLLGSGVPG